MKPPFVIDTKKETVRLDFDSWTDYLEAAGNRFDNCDSADSRLSWRSADDNAYPTFDEAVQKCRFGDHALTAEIVKIGASLPPVTARERRRRPVPAMCGHAPIVGAAIVGHPLSMMRFNRLEGSRPIIRIGVNVSISGGVSGLVMAKRGAAVLALCDALETAGYAVQIDILDGTAGYNGDWKANFRATIKRPESYVDPGILAAALLTAAPCRRLYFALAEQLPTTDLRSTFGVGGGYGRPRDHEDASTYDLYMPKVRLGEKDFDTPTAAADWCQNWLNKLTGGKP